MSFTKWSFIACISGLLMVPVLIFAQGPEGDWYFKDRGTDNLNGLGINSIYNSLPSDAKPQQIIVAILDSGIDLEHEDLEANIWVNEDEIPGNGIDDDNNGYVDDVHGWNYLGGRDGQMVVEDNLEVARLYKKYSDYFEGKDPEKLSGKDKKLYEAFTEYQRVMEKERGKAKRQLEQIEETESMLLAAIDAFDKEYPGQVIDKEFMNSFKSGDDEQMAIIEQIFGQVKEYDMELESTDELRELIIEGYAPVKENSLEVLDYHYNPDWDIHKIIGGQEGDPENIFGNHDVEGDFAFHGTHVAGIVGAVSDNDIGTRGIAPNVKLMILRMVPNGDERDLNIASAIRYAADNGASIINMSFGKGYSPKKQEVDKAVKYARKKDVLLVHAAGNAAENNDKINHYPIPQYEKKGLFGKKEADNWIEVGALGWEYNEDAIASFSNYGAETVDLFAPGVQIYSTAPGNDYRNASGTSMAAPVVSGVAALLRSYYPTLTARQVKDVLVNSVHQPSMKVRNPETHELVNFSDLCKSHGILDARAAFEAATKAKGKKKVKAQDATVGKA